MIHGRTARADRRTHLTRDEQRRDAYELQLGPLALHVLQVAVEDVDAQPQRLGLQLELVRHFDEPVHEDRSHLAVHVLLMLQRRIGV